MARERPVRWAHNGLEFTPKEGKENSFEGFHAGDNQPRSHRHYRKIFPDRTEVGKPRQSGDQVQAVHLEWADVCRQQKTQYLANDETTERWQSSARDFQGATKCPSSLLPDTPTTPFEVSCHFIICSGQQKGYLHKETKIQHIICHATTVSLRWWLCWLGSRGRGGRVKKKKKKTIKFKLKLFCAK